MIQTANLSKVRAYLSRQPVLNLNILGILESVPGAEVFADQERTPQGVAVRAGDFLYCFTESARLGFIPHGPVEWFGISH